MADQWYYRMFGQDFGPVSFNELKQLADLGSISPDDEVRQSSGANWTPASDVADLGLSAGQTKSAPTAIAELPAPGGAAGANDWYYMFHGVEMGPIGFEEIVEFAQQGQLEANDEVRLGASGKWRRVGSIGRLVAVLPYHEPITPTPPPAVVAPRPVVKAPTPVQPEPAPAPVVEAAIETAPTPPAVDTGLIQAEAAYLGATQAAKSLVAWALAPNLDPTWWGWIGGAERGPVGFVQIYDWATTGQLQLTDYVKNGLLGQYTPAANVPGLSNAVAIVASAKQALETAKAISAETAALMRSNPVVAVPSTPAPARPSSPAVATVSAPAPAKPSKPDLETVAPRSVPTEAAVPAPAPRSIEEPKPARASSPSIDTPPAPISAPRPMPTPSVSSYAAAAMSPARPAPRPQPKSSRSSSSSDSGIGDMVKDPKVLGGIGAVALVVLLYFGAPYISLGAGKDGEIYRQSKQLLDDVRAARASNSTSFDAFKTRAQKLKDEYVPGLKEQASNQKPHKQALLFALRDEFPRMMGGNLAEESIAEKNVAAHLKIVADRLGLK